MSWFVYILQCADGSYYTGITTDLPKRLHEHNHLTQGARYTKSRRPVVLKYMEASPSLSAARKRELEIQRWKRTKKRELVLSQNLNDRGGRKNS